MRLIAALVALGLTAPVAAQTAHHHHEGHTMPAGDAVPAPPGDHAADAVHDPADMARARNALAHENGGMTLSSVSFDLAEYQVRDGRDGYRWEGDAWFGRDIDRLVVKHEGEGAFGGGIERAELQLLWSRALDPWWNLQAGLRQDAGHGPDRTYVSLGIEGLAPYWFELAGTLFVSDKGDMHIRAEGHYDLRITQRLILQPRIEANVAFQDVPQSRIGSGLSDVEAGLRLGYEIRRELTPYVGVEWTRKAGGTARYARADGEDPSVTSILFGVRTWF